MENHQPPTRTRLAYPTLGLSTASLLAACGGGGGILGAIIVVVLIATLAAPAVPLVVFPGGEATKPAALLPFTAEARAVATSPDGARLYIADTLHNSVAIMDSATRRITHMVDVGTGPHNIAVTPDGARALVANHGTNLHAGNAVSIIDTSNATVTQSLIVGQRPHGIAITSDGSKAYVANRADNSLSVIDLATSTVANTVDTTSGYNGLDPAALLLTGNGGLFVADRGSNTVTLIDTQTDLVVNSVGVGNAPSGLALAAESGRVFVSNRDSDNVSVLDASSGALLDTLLVDEGPVGLVTSPDGARVYVAHAYGGREDDLCGLEGTPVRNSVRVIDVATQSVLPGEITVGNTPLAVVITGDNTKLYAVSACNDPVTDQGVVSAANVGAITDNAALIAASISTVSRGVAAALAPGSEQLYVLHPHAISVIDVATDSVSGAPLAVRGNGPTRLTFSNDGTRLFALRPGSAVVTVLDVTPGNGLLQRAGSMSVGPGASALITNPGIEEVYVANAGVSRSPGSTLTVLDVTPAGTTDDSPETVPLQDNSVNPAALARGPVALAVNEDHTDVYAAAFGDFFPNSREPGRFLARLTLATRTVTHFDAYAEWPLALQVDDDADMAANGQVSVGGAGVLYVAEACCTWPISSIIKLPAAASPMLTLRFHISPTSIPQQPSPWPRIAPTSPITKRRTAPGRMSRKSSKSTSTAASP